MPAQARHGEEFEKQEVPEVRVIGRISTAGTIGDGNGDAGVKFLVHTAWSGDKIFQVSQRGIKVLRSLDIEVLDDPENYTV